jgi:hypothetical protein
MWSAPKSKTGGEWADAMERMAATVVGRVVYRMSKGEGMTLITASELRRLIGTEGVTLRCERRANDTPSLCVYDGGELLAEVNGVRWSDGMARDVRSWSAGLTVEELLKHWGM